MVINDKQTARAEAKRQKTAIKAAADLDRACSSVNAFLQACRDCGDLRTQQADDSRRSLISIMSEYSTYLNSVFGR